MPKVVMTVATAYGSTIKKGDVVDVPDDVAARWVKNKIAKYAGVEPEEQKEPVKYENYKAAELQSIAQAREIEGWSSMKKADLVKALTNDDEKRG